MSYKPGDTITVEFTTTNYGGALADADVMPTATPVLDGADQTAATVTKKATATYDAVFTAGAGWAAGQSLALRVNATIGGVATATTYHLGCLDSARLADKPAVKLAAGDVTGHLPVIVQDYAEGYSPTEALDEYAPPTKAEMDAGTSVIIAYGDAHWAHAPVYVLPVQSSLSSTGRLEPTYLTAYQGCRLKATMQILDRDGQPVDLTGKTLALVAWDKDATAPAWTLRNDGESPELTVGGADHNQLTIDAAATRTADAATQLDWRLYDVASRVPLATGVIKIEAGFFPEV